jgi:hypothetical protein
VAISVPSPCRSEGGKRLKNLGGGEEGENNHAEFILSHVRFFASLRMTGRRARNDSGDTERYILRQAQNERREIMCPP